jgi:hypothetical protein
MAYVGREQNGSCRRHSPCRSFQKGRDVRVWSSYTGPGRTTGTRRSAKTNPSETLPGASLPAVPPTLRSAYAVFTLQVLQCYGTRNGRTRTSFACCTWKRSRSRSAVIHSPSPGFDQLKKCIGRNHRRRSARVCAAALPPEYQRSLPPRPQPGRHRRAAHRHDFAGRLRCVTFGCCAASPLRF